MGAIANPTSFGDHKLRLLTDPDYRRAKGLPPLEVAPADAPSVPETGERVVEVDPALVRQLDEWKSAKKDSERRTKELGALIDAAEDELVEQYAAAGVTSLDLDGRRATARATLWLRKVNEDVTAADVAAALRADRLDELVQPEGYNASQISAWARRLEENGEPLPPNVAKVLVGWNRWAIAFTSPRPSRAAKLAGGARSSVLSGESAAR
jgi:hypothetical protein